MDGKIYDGRIQWLDAMRGFTMLMVVAYHTELLAFQETEKTSAAMTLLVLFRMPLFFFVSGFLAYSSRFAATLGDVAALVWKRCAYRCFPPLSSCVPISSSARQVSPTASCRRCTVP